jgi:hypothetical protein
MAKHFSTLCVVLRFYHLLSQRNCWRRTAMMRHASLLLLMR